MAAIIQTSLAAARRLFGKTLAPPPEPARVVDDGIVLASDVTQRLLRRRVGLAGSAQAPGAGNHAAVYLTAPGQTYVYDLVARLYFTTAAAPAGLSDFAAIGLAPIPDPFPVLSPGGNAFPKLGGAAMVGEDVVAAPVGQTYYALGNISGEPLQLGDFGDLEPRCIAFYGPENRAFVASLQWSEAI